MSALFDERMKEALAFAKKLELAGEMDLSRQMCVRCVEKVAIYNNEDLLKLFYGNSVYDKLQRVTDAMKYIYIASCLMDVYNLISSKSPANNTGNAWAKSGSTSSNAQLVTVFEWLSHSGRNVERKDSEHFKKIMRELSKPETIDFQMSTAMERYTLLSIIKGLVDGYISVSRTGELKNGK